MFLDTRLDGESRAVAVPDNPWSTVYRGPSVRAAAGELVSGLGDRVAWERYVAVASDRPEPELVLSIADRAYGKRMRVPKRRARK